MEDTEEMYSQVKMGRLLDFYQKSKLDDKYTRITNYIVYCTYIIFKDQRIFSYITYVDRNSAHQALYGVASAHGPLLSSSGMQTVPHLSLLSAWLTISVFSVQTHAHVIH